jgi:hypothetical protein
MIALPARTGGSPIGLSVTDAWMTVAGDGKAYACSGHDTNQIMPLPPHGRLDGKDSHSTSPETHPGCFNVAPL